MLTPKIVVVAAALLLAACPDGRPRVGNGMAEAGAQAQVVLDELAARRLAAEMANEAFVNASLHDAVGNPVTAPKLSPGDLRARRSGARWQLSYGGPAGHWAEVSFDERGQRPSVEVGFAAD